MMGSIEALHLTFDAEPESIGRARRATAEWAGRSGVEPRLIDDLRTVVSEAATNVVRHAYPEKDGSFQLQAELEDDRLLLVVRDFGDGLRPIVAAPSSLRLGLGLISTLSSRYEIFGHEGGGTELRIHFDLAG